MKFLPICILLLLSLLPCYLSAQDKPKCRIRLPEQLAEVSGLYYAAPDSLWWHNDSGDGPRLYLTDGEGHLTYTLDLPMLRHTDWEDLTADDHGNIYIGDFGNNRRDREDLRIYRVQPGSGLVDSIHFRFPAPFAGDGLDTEAFFWYRDSLHLFTKSRIRGERFVTKHFALADRGGTQTAEFRDSLSLKRRVVTGAAIDPLSETVVLVGYNYGKFLGIIPYSAASAFYLNDYPDGHFLKGHRKRKGISCLWALQYESVDFVNEKYVYVAAEKTLWIRAKAKRRKWRRP